MKYKLLKDIDDCNAGQVFEYPFTDNETTVEMAACVRLMDCISLQHGEWFEEIKEVKSIYNLKEGDNISIIESGIVYNDVNYKCADYSKYRAVGDVFLTKEEAEVELEERKDIAGLSKYCHDNPDDVNAPCYFNKIIEAKISASEYFNRIH